MTLWCFAIPADFQVVDLADIFTGRLISEIPQSLSALCDALKDHTSLLELDLSDNAFGGRCADSMTSFLRSNTHFSTFKLNNNGLGPIGGNIIAEALLANAQACKAEGKPSSLRVVVCGRNRLENGSAPKWAEAFKAHGGLREVRMPQNGIRMEGIAALAQGLAANSQLESLDLQDNTATKTGTRSLVKVLSEWPELRSLNLSDCLLGSAGGIALATALSLGSNKKLESLKLQYGELDGRTVELLAEAIAQHLPELTVLELNGNRFDPDDDSVEKLRKALGVHGHEDALDDCGLWIDVMAVLIHKWTTWKSQTRRKKRKRTRRKRKRTRRQASWMGWTSRSMVRTLCHRPETRRPTSELTIHFKIPLTLADWPIYWQASMSSRNEGGVPKLQYSQYGRPA